MSDDIHEWVLELRLAIEKARAAGAQQMTVTASLTALETIATCVDAYFHNDNLEPPCFVCGLRADRYIMAETTRILEKSLRAHPHDWRKDAALYKRNPNR